MEDQRHGAAHPAIDVSPAARTSVGVTTPPNATAASKIGEAAQQAGAQVREKAGALAAEATDKAKGYLGNQVAAGADFLGQIGRSATAAADSLELDAPQLAGFVRSMATSVSDLSNTVRGQSPEQLLDTASTYVRQNPALVLSAAAVCGFALARLLQGGTWSGSRAGATDASVGGTSRSDAI